MLFITKLPNYQIIKLPNYQMNQFLNGFWEVPETAAQFVWQTSSFCREALAACSQYYGLSRNQNSKSLLTRWYLSWCREIATPLQQSKSINNLGWLFNYPFTKLLNYSMFNEPHDPSGYPHASDENGKAVGAIADHLARAVAETDPEHDRREQ
jgi:hypothetical protein